MMLYANGYGYGYDMDMGKDNQSEYYREIWLTGCTPASKQAGRQSKASANTVYLQHARVLIIFMLMLKLMPP